MVQMAEEVVSARFDDVGVFMPNCPFHVATKQPPNIYQDLFVDNVIGENFRANLPNILYNWLNNAGGAFVAVENPQFQNPSCRFE